jgi:hypothetical protein
MSKTENGERVEMASSGVPLAIAEDNGAEAPTPTKLSALDGAGRRKSTIDLAAWARGERNHLFIEVAMAIDDLVMAEILQLADARLAGVTSPRGALEFLLSEGIIDAEDARTDL